MAKINRSGLEGRNDFLGFTFDGKHSSEFGIVRVSDGTRMNDQLLPQQNPKTIKQPGIDGMGFLGVEYGVQNFNFDLVYDDMSETKMRKLAQWLKTDTPRPLILDELPHKVYDAQLATNISRSFIPFREYDPPSDRTKDMRTYKGEMNLSFTCFRPWAKSRAKCYQDFITKKYHVGYKDEWFASTGMKENLNGYDTFNVSGTAKYFNPGDKPAPWSFYFRPQKNDGNIHIRLSPFEPENKTEVIVLDLTKIPLSPNSMFKLDSNLSLLMECDSAKIPTGRIYNHAIIAGDFYDIPLGEGRITISPFSNNLYLYGDEFGRNLIYDYLYY